ncbi:Ribonuclease Y [Gossypium arboreum]|uniref:Ribonuclease Y n=1 Tax=Gossypium arboreum TaxID=29729 RepID=A0A0B0NHG9_GOSAR|nr:Ribonuclease Y [Gossypium arboreum]
MSGIKNQRNQIWIGGKLKLSISRPVPIFIVRDHVWEVGIDIVVMCKTMSGTSTSYLIRVRPCLGQWHRYEIAYFEI